MRAIASLEAKLAPTAESLRDAREELATHRWEDTQHQSTVGHVQKVLMQVLEGAVRVKSNLSEQRTGLAGEVCQLW